MSSLLGKIIIVTGGSGLIGKAIVERLKMDNGIVINADISHNSNLDENIYQCDITSQKSINELVEFTISKFKLSGYFKSLISILPKSSSGKHKNVCVS